MQFKNNSRIVCCERERTFNCQQKSIPFKRRKLTQCVENGKLKLLTEGHNKCTLLIYANEFSPLLDRSPFFSSLTRPYRSYRAFVSAAPQFRFQSHLLCCASLYTMLILFRESTMRARKTTACKNCLM
jgi:hypothetical protein